jgi:hypothetical protein
MKEKQRKPHHKCHAVKFKTKNKGITSVAFWTSFSEMFGSPHRCLSKSR